MFQIFATFTQAIDNVLVNGMSAAISGGIAFTSTYINVALSIYVIGYGFMMLYSKGDLETWVSGIWRAIAIVALLQIANYDYYVEQLFFTDLPNAIARALNGPGLSLKSASQFDVLWSASLNATATAAAAASDTWFGPVYRILAYAAAGLMLVALGLMWLVWYLARVFMSVVICMGPFLLILFLFKRTEGFAYSWVGKLVGLTALQLASSILLRIILKIVTQQMLDMQHQLQGNIDSMLGVLASMAGIYWMGTLIMVCLPSAIAIGSGTGAAAAVASSRLLSAGAAVTMLPFRR